MWTYKVEKYWRFDKKYLMKNNFLRNILFLAFGLIMIFFWIFIWKNIFIKIDIEKNIVSIEKEEKILENPFESQNPGKIFSKWIFIKNNLVLTVAHGTWEQTDNYKIFWNKKIFDAKLAKKWEKDDLAILETKGIFEEFEKTDFWLLKKNDKKIYFFENWEFKSIDFSIDKENIFIKKEFLPGDSGTIFFNEKKKIIWILTDYNLEKKVWIIKILNKKILENF